MKIVIFGSGNVAWVLGHLLQKKGHNIAQVIARNVENGQALADALHCSYTPAVADAHTDADIFLLAVADNALYGLPAVLPVSKAIVVHTAGAISMDMLKMHPNHGVFYPLQTINRFNNQRFSASLPLLITANNTESANQLLELAHSISTQVQLLNDKERLVLHLAAVMVNNFTNHLYVLAQKLCEAEAVPFELLHPIITQTALQVQGQSAVLLQTGPALRQDTATMQKHINLLQQYPSLKNIYLKLSESIINFKPA
jgi:predicted short-subunit dehydrogenase-like oxidoreductase (DUF2520 family)